MRNARSSALAVVALALGLFGLGAAAWSFWSSSGAGAANAVVGTLDPPSGVSGSPSGSTVALDWTGPAAPGGGPVDGYYVQRSPGTPGGTCASSPSLLLPATPTSCSDTALPSGTYTYTVVAVFRSWTASAGSGPVSVANDHLQVTAPAAAPAGSAFDVTVTAQDASGLTDATYTGAKTLVWSDPGPAPSGTAPSYPASVTFTNGIGSASITLFRAETTTLTATQGTVTGTSAGIVVSAGTATRFAPIASSPQVAGSSFDLAVTAQDAFENTAPTYTGVQPLVWSGPGAAPNGGVPSYPPSVTFTNGAGTASITLVRAEATTLTATQGSVTGTSAGIVVEPGTTTRFAAVAATPQTAGSPFSLTVTAQDAFRNTATGYAGTVRFSSTDAQAVLPANYTFVAADAGTRTFSGGVTLKTAASQVVTVTDVVDTARTGGAGVTVSPAAAAKLAVSQQPTDATAGVTITPAVTVRIEDQFGNRTTSTASVTLAVTGGGATLGGTATQPGEGGLAAFSNLSVTKAGAHTLTATTSGLASGTSAPFSISAAAASKLAFTSSTHNCSSASVTVGNGGTFSSMVSVVDAFGNPVAVGSVTTVALANNQANARLSSLSLTIAADSPETGSGFTQSIPVGSPPDHKVTASSAGLTSVSCSVKKN